ncbi:PREDICTED: uncharacterized protein LOC109154047 [Ipomoea nil]|uniref:uncharacterized protein LOC109154047 n=1 Tax=Ipomoea nil TaxID=35883 RepID=UPI0009008B45|nr:PREDICTED: uncharacterized protein LOC109154047 [Ipomoea nil]
MVLERNRSYAAAVSTDHEAGNDNSTGNTVGASTPASQIHLNQNLMHRVDEVDDPMYLHVTENPNLVLVSPPLSESNYATWSRSMKLALGVKNKFGFVSGSIRSPGESDVRFAAWKRSNDIVCSWILRSVNPTIAESVLYYELAEDIWNALRKRYSQTDPHKIAEIQNEIYRSVQGNMSINEYFTKCNGLWEKLNAVRPLPICECVPRCVCSLRSKIQKDREEDQVIRFLEGINEGFDSIKSGILVMVPLPTMEKVLNMTLKLGRKLNGATVHKNNEVIQANAVQNQVADDENIVAMTASNNRKKFNSSTGKNVPKCTYCGMNGHTVEKCYKKHGFPPEWVQGYKSKNRQVQDSQQNFSSGFGGLNHSVNEVGDIGLSPDQFKRLMSLLQTQNQGSQSSTSAAIAVNDTGMKSNFTKILDNSKEGKFLSNSHISAVLNCPTVWIVDSGATDHITCSLEYIENCFPINDVSVKLPNGEVVQVTHMGEVRLLPDLLLKNVLYIPSFTFNIVSTSKLTKQTGCTIMMSTDSCDIQGPHGRVDGFAKEKDGLYLLSQVPAKKKFFVRIIVSVTV